jgi:hypothetical protein
MMSKKLLKKEDLKNLSHNDLIKLGAATIVGHLANDLEKELEDEQINHKN